MKVSLKWLSEFVELPGSVPELTELLTLAGVEVEDVQKLGADIPKVVVAQIQESTQHPNADRLSVCKVDDGSGIPRQIVCGAKNYKVGDKVPLALPGAVLPGDFKIKVGKLRGVESEGMLCSADELGLPKGEDGLMILPGDAKAGTPLSELLPSDTIIEIEITPNRADLLSYTGIAREVAALTGRALKLPPAAPALAGVAGQISIETPECPLYTVLAISNIKVGPSPEWLRAKLEASGLRAINNIVDITNFVMLETGQPLHAFDAAKVNGEIRVRAATEGEQFLALDGRTYRLSPENVVIADTRRALAIAGVMGGEDSGVTAQTQNVLLECAAFAPSNIRRTSRTLGLSSDSSYRFERGVDTASMSVASQRAAALIVELAGGTVGDFRAGGAAVAGEGVIVPLRLERVNSLLGVEVPPGRIEEILTGFGLLKVEAGWQIPSFRKDLTREVDLIEEIARVVGIENIPARLSAFPARPGTADAAYDFVMEIRQKLVGLGFSEARTSTLVPESALAVKDAAIRLKNPLGEDQSYLRPSLVSGLLGSLAHNIRQGAKSVMFFEVGRTFHSGAKEETTSLGVLLYGASAPADWRGAAGRTLDWHDAKGAIEALGNFALNKGEPTESFALAAAIETSGTKIGFLAQLAPSAARALGVTEPVLVAEIDLDALRSSTQAGGFSSIPKFPSTVRDIAVVAPVALPYADMDKILRAANEPLLVAIAPINIFTDASGGKLAADCKSVAISLTFRSPERTLNTDEVNAACERLKKQLKDELAVSFRE